MQPSYRTAEYAAHSLCDESRASIPECDARRSNRIPAAAHLRRRCRASNHRGRAVQERVLRGEEAYWHYKLARFTTTTAAK